MARDVSSPGTDLSHPAASVAPAAPPANGRGPTPLPARRLPSDDYAVVVNGETYRPHAGESLYVAARRTIGQEAALEEAGRPREAESAAERLARFWAHLTAGYLLAWDWTDPATGEPLPPPDAPGVHARLTEDEYAYVVRKAGNEWREPAPN